MSARPDEIPFLHRRTYFAANSGRGFRPCADRSSLSWLLLYLTETHGLPGVYYRRQVRLRVLDHSLQTSGIVAPRACRLSIIPEYHRNASRGCFHCLPVVLTAGPAAVFLLALPVIQPDARPNQRSRPIELLRLLSCFFSLKSSLVCLLGRCVQTPKRPQRLCHISNGAAVESRISQGLERLWKRLIFNAIKVRNSLTISTVEFFRAFILHEEHFSIQNEGLVRTSALCVADLERHTATSKPCGICTRIFPSRRATTLLQHCPIAKSAGDCPY